MGSLRDRRWLERFSFALTDPLFYEPFDVKYKHKDEFINVVKDIFPPSWTIKREGLWVYVEPPNYEYPAQGWKIHISATPENVLRVLKKSSRILKENSTAFKFIVDYYIFTLINDKSWPRGGSGKFITVYPKNNEHFKRIIEELYIALKDEKGPYILSDNRYKDCKVLYYRYGGIKRMLKTNVLGIKEPVIISPDGKPYPDERKPYYELPPWVEEIFPDDDEEVSDEILLNGGKYLVEEALHFSNSGGVYLARDISDGRKVVIKEARPFTAYTSRGEDAVERLKREFLILKDIEHLGIAPKPIEIFKDWEHHFLVEEYIDGKDLRIVSLENSPLLRQNPTKELSERFLGIFSKIFVRISSFLKEFHNMGYVFGDISPRNIMITEDFNVKIVDFESAFKVGDKPIYLSTPGFSSGEFSAEGDLKTLGTIMMYFLFPILAMRDIKEDIFDAPLSEMINDLGWPSEIAELIRDVHSGKAKYDEISYVLKGAEVERNPHFRVDRITNDEIKSLMDGIYEFLIKNMRYEGEILIPTDPFAYITNTLSLGFGASGILYSIKKSGYDVPKKALIWFENRLRSLNREDFPPGILTGLAGISWCSWELGYYDFSESLLNMANEHSLLYEHPSYYYGSAGVGLANLFLYTKTNKQPYLDKALEIAKNLIESSIEDENGVHWETEGKTYIGFGYGQSGVALFLLRLYQITGDERFLEVGYKALMYDIRSGEELEDGVITFKEFVGDATFESYLEVGTAGILKVALRYGYDDVESLIKDVSRKYAVFPTLIFGLSGLLDALIDVKIYRNYEEDDMLLKPITGIRRLFTIEKDGICFPGEGLYRVSCDYASGMAGILRTLSRLTYLDMGDFTLDEMEGKNAGILEANKGV